LRKMGIVDTAIWAQVNEFVEQILRKSGDNNMQALSLSRVPHLRGMGSLHVCADGATTSACSVEVTYSGGKRAATGQSITLSSDNVLLATGSRALRLATLDEWYDEPLGGHIRCHDSDSIKRLSFLPRSVVVIGGGIIAVEFARIFAALAADVTMIVRASDLPNSLSRVGIDRQIGYLLQSELLASGVTLLFESEVTGAKAVVASRSQRSQRKGGRAQGDQLRLDVVRTGTTEERSPILTDLVLSATGRKAVTQGLGLEELGIEIKPNGDVAVGSDLMTSSPGVYAAGDLIGAPQLASTGIEQAESAVDAMFTLPDDRANAELATRQDCSPAALLSNAARYPNGIWTMPELAFVGLTAAAAAAPPHNLDVVEGIGRYSESLRGHGHTVGTGCEGEYLAGYVAPGGGDASPAAAGQDKPLSGPALKLVVERKSPHRVVGVHVFGDDACELIHFGTTLVQGGKSLSDILALCFAAVTYHELFKLAARDAIATMQKDAWRSLYLTLDYDSDGGLTPDEVTRGLEKLGADSEAIDDIMKALFTASCTSVGIEQFVKRAARMRSPLQFELMDAGGDVTKADVAAYEKNC